MRITIVQGAFFPVPPLLGGAVEKVWYALGKQFARLGHEVTHVSRRWSDLASEEVVDGVRHIRIDGFDAPRSMAAYKLCDLIYSWRVRRVLPPADILVTNTFWLPILVRDGRCGSLYVHVGRYPKGQMRFYTHAARLQTVSTPIAKAILEEVPGRYGKLAVIPNPLSHEPASNVIEESWRARRNHFLYVGRIHPEKGLDLLLDAFARLIHRGHDGWRLVVVGPWEANQGGGGERYYRTLRRQYGFLGTNIVWVGPVFDSTQLADFYKTAKIFVYPSLAEKGETFGLAPLEAMSFGCPVLVSGLECFRDFIEDGRSGFVFNHRAKDPAGELSRKLLELSTSSDLAARSMEAHVASGGYGLDDIAKRYLRDFERVARSQPTREQNN